MSSNFDPDQEIQEPNQEIRKNQEIRRNPDIDNVCYDCQKEKVHLCLSDELNSGSQSQAGESRQSMPGDDQSKPQDDQFESNQQPQCKVGEERQQENSPKTNEIFFDYTDVILAIEDIPNGT